MPIERVVLGHMPGVGDGTALGAAPAGRQVDLYTLRSDSGLEASVSTYGGALVSLKTPDRDGNLDDVVLGFDTLEGYIEDTSTQGALVGRVCNRIGNARFELEGETYELDRNCGKHQLHGGSRGFHKRVWGASASATLEGPVLTLTHVSEDGDQGFPGEMHVQATYSFVGKGLRIELSAEADQPTPVNLTNHAYFNLAGQAAGSKACLEHRAIFHAKQTLNVDEDLIPDGKLLSILGTPLDFTKETAIGERIDARDALMKLGFGYDHYYVLDKEIEADEDCMRLAARVADPTSGRIMELRTTYPGFQFYTGNHLNGLAGKGGATYEKRSGFCLEASGYNNAINCPEFPSCVLCPGEKFEAIIEYRFG